MEIKDLEIDEDGIITVEVPKSSLISLSGLLKKPILKKLQFGGSVFFIIDGRTIYKAKD